MYVTESGRDRWRGKRRRIGMCNGERKSERERGEKEREREKESVCVCVFCGLVFYKLPCQLPLAHTPSTCK